MLSAASLPASWRAAAEFVADTSRVESFAELDAMAPGRLRHVFGADLVVWERFDSSLRHLAFRLDSLPSRPESELHSAFVRHFPEHPGYPHFGKLFARGDTFVLSDFGATRRFVQTGLWSEVYIHLRARHQLGLAAPIEGGAFQTTSVNRLGRDFGSHEREVARFIQPYYPQIVSRVGRRERAARIAHGLAEFFRREAAYALVGADGTLHECSPAARAFFAAEAPASGAAHDRLPETFAAVLRALQQTSFSGPVRRVFRTVALPGGRTALILHLHPAPSGPAVVVFQTATTAAAARVHLTARESEILTRIGTGHSNSAIATALGISSRTVEKHCTTLFAKIGVETRFAAALLARSGGIR